MSNYHIHIHEFKWGNKNTSPSYKYRRISYSKIPIEMAIRIPFKLTTVTTDDDDKQNIPFEEQLIAYLLRYIWKFSERDLIEPHVYRKPI